jgi:hypothetical protein
MRRAALGDRSFARGRVGPRVYGGHARTPSPGVRFRLAAIHGARRHGGGVRTHKPADALQDVSRASATGRSGSATWEVKRAAETANVLAFNAAAQP